MLGHRRSQHKADFNRCSLFGGESMKGFGSSRHFCLHLLLCDARGDFPIPQIRFRINLTLENMNINIGSVAVN